ncbi:hypothetical protein ACTHGU_20025 [Chitinophagaceae bacterium MMS25-I14]
MTFTLNVQRIKTEWGKEARGGKMAALRNAYPEIVLIDKSNTRKYFRDNETGIEQNVEFTTYKLHGDDECLFENGYVRAMQEGDNVKMMLSGPGEYFYKTLCVLEPGTWLQVRYNGIYPLEHTWRYFKVVLNIHNGDLASLPEDYFLNMPPIGSFSRRIWTSKEKE